MLKEIELANFLSHSSTRLEFNNGVTVFVGQNGAGKSSIIDGITFALFGQHTRNSNRGLVRRGTNQAYSKVSFSISDRRFEAVRKIDSKGTVSAQFFEKKDGALIPLASGERKQFGESMTKTIESLIGMDFDKLKVASIVQQGELNSIINADPKKFKELVNAIIGIDKLDTAFEMMKGVIENFRHYIKKELEYDDKDVEPLKAKLDLVTILINETQPKLHELESFKQKQESELKDIQNKISSHSTTELKVKELERRKLEFKNYIKNAITSYQKDIQEKENKLADCQGCFGHVKLKKEIDKKISQVKTKLEIIRNEIQEFNKKIANFEGQRELASQLALKNGRCPVCDSKVDHLNPMFQVEHIQNEVGKIKTTINTLKKKEKDADKELQGLEKNREKALRSESTLLAHKINVPEDLELLRTEIINLKNNIQKISTQLNSSSGLMQFSAFDANSENMIKAISLLEDETKGFDLTELNSLKINCEQKERSLKNTIQEIGAMTHKLQEAKTQKIKISQTLDELDLVKKYVSNLEEIRSQIFNRDGPVAVSLRSWALNVISQKASEYLSAFNVKIQRILLQEKARDVGITCYSGNTVLELESLSGGEKVSIALALRLGMAHLLGASNLNFIILDEPTTHLDEERRKSLVQVLSNAFESNLGAISQFIIITHDTEIFENSNVDTIYNFEATPEGTKVTAL